MQAIQNIRDEIARRIGVINALEEKTELQKALLKNYNSLLDLIKEQKSCFCDLPKLTLRDVLEGINGDSSHNRAAFEVIGGRNSKILYRSWNGNNRKLPERYLDLEISTINGRYSIEPRVIMRDYSVMSPWRNERQYLLCYYEITVSQPFGIGD